MQAQRAIEIILPAASSAFIDLGAGVGKVMWHAGVAAEMVNTPEGVEYSSELVDIADRIAAEVIGKAADNVCWKQWSMKQVMINVWQFLTFHSLPKPHAFFLGFASASVCEQ